MLPELPNKGHVMCNVELNGLANRNIHPTTLNSKVAQALSSQLQRSMDRLVCPDAASQLNIYSELDCNRAVGSYTLKIDIIVLHDDGCLIDACLPAALTAILTARWPKLVGIVDHTSGGVGAQSTQQQYKSKSPNQFCSFKVNTDWPIPISFCLLPLAVADASSTAGAPPPLIVQPSRRELSLWDADAGPLHMTVSSKGKVFDMSMVNAFLPAVWNGREDSKKRKTDSPSPCKLWTVVADCAKEYACTVESAIRAACSK